MGFFGHFYLADFLRKSAKTAEAKALFKEIKSPILSRGRLVLTHQPLGHKMKEGKKA